MKYRMYKKGTGYLLDTLDMPLRSLPNYVVDLSSEVYTAIFNCPFSAKREFLNQLWTAAQAAVTKKVTVSDTNKVSDRPTRQYEE